ncbi:MAG: phage virion morphogenesis protein [Sphingobacteriaceae bacterium]|nr:phage virion morphogenesis protein [Sphingobacteriaceae bacterium]
MNLISLMRNINRVTLRYIDDNFRAQGYQANTLIPWRKTGSGKENRFSQKSNGILIQTGRLRRGFQSSVTPSSVIISNAAPYANMHNQGFKGAIQIKAHTRRTFGVGKVANIETKRYRSIKVETGIHPVKAHSRNVEIPRRQFVPTANRPSGILNAAIEKEINNYVMSQFKSGKIHI